ncbi:SURF1 family cytochrome oxidase biogenesis protein [Rickettsia endosymbiont of Halotydeus destructor]|uniref:SURF1 family cytochrome oxidase biogenesis protein n=1 Tax=Rickettsia endosymbiont of Halotydeus destructor TaxID=2996754 RepID=UPI003BB1AC86
MNKKNNIITFFTLCTVIILIILGFWQLNRLKEKKLFLAAMDHNLTSPAVDLKDLKDDFIYHKVKITGHFLPGQDIHLYGRRSMSKEKDGYYLVTPFKTIDDKIILVARGWFSNRNKSIIGDSANRLFSKLAYREKFKGDTEHRTATYSSVREDSSTGSTYKLPLEVEFGKKSIEQEHEIIGVTMPSEKIRSYIPDNDIKNNVWLTLDLKAATKILDLELQNFYIIQEGKDISNLDILLPLSINHLANIRNDHLEYALTWFGLAISLIVIYIIYSRARATEPRKYKS